jgi:predicted nucleic acid-binding Zn ribbon protein
MKRKSAPERIGAIVESLLADRGYLSVCKEQDVVRRWSELAGAAIAAATQCERVERGVLYVRVPSSSWRQELVYLKPTLLARVRGECKSITDIVFC